MATEQEGKKPNYQVMLKERAEQLYQAMQDQPDEAEQLVLDTLKETALESWKNGIDAGKRKARQAQATSTDKA